jgi:hypothetical protein
MLQQRGWAWGSELSRRHLRRFMTAVGWCWVLGEEIVGVGMPSCEASTTSYSGCGGAHSHDRTIRRSIIRNRRQDRRRNVGEKSVEVLCMADGRRYCTDLDDSDSEGDVASDNTWCEAAVQGCQSSQPARNDVFASS